MSWNWCWNWWRNGDDNLTGSSGRDWLFGGRGNDTIDGGAGNDRIWGGRGDDIMYGGDGNDRIYGGRGDDSIDGGAGNDKVKGGSGDDTVDGGAGSDRVYAGRGDDVGVYNVAENVGSKDYYNGGHGTDHLVLQMTTAEYNSEAVQADLARFQAFLDGDGHGWGHHAHSFKFEAFDLKVKNWESFSVMRTDAGENEAPVANDDVIMENAKVIPDLEPNNPPNDPGLSSYADNAQVIDRADFRIDVSGDVGDDALPRVSVEGLLSPDSDVDLYAITLQESETLILDIDYGFESGTDSVNTQLFLFEENGSVTLLDWNEFSSPTAGGGGSAFPSDAYLAFTAGAGQAGTYYVAVSTFDNDPVGLNPDGTVDGTFDGTFGGGNGPLPPFGGDYVLNISIGGSTDPSLGAFVISAADLLGNDTDAENDALTIISVGNGINAAVLELTPSGDVLFKPASEHAASFEYTISDGNGGQSTAIAAVNGNTILGTPNPDNLADSAGNDLFTGGDGGDTFTFGDDDGIDADTITDFTVGSDFLAFTGGVDLASTPLSNHVDGTVVNFDNGDSVLLVGIDVTNVNELFA